MAQHKLRQTNTYNYTKYKIMQHKKKDNKAKANNTPLACTVTLRACIDVVSS